MAFRILALDLDRTLLNDDHQISPQDAKALQEAAARGIHIVFASGRMSASIRLFTKPLDLDGPIVSYNGAMARDSRARGDGVLLEIPLAARYADELIEYAGKEGFHLNYYLEETLFARDDPELRRFADLYHSRTGSPYQFVSDLERFKGCSPTKIILLADPSEAANPHPRNRDEQYQLWKSRWGDEVNIVRTDPEYLEFMNPKATKGAALEAIARHLGVPREEVIAMGRAK
jgi:Cof subfamily protein (haloacid dehalogenase superfamily)